MNYTNEQLIELGRKEAERLQKKCKHLFHPIDNNILECSMCKKEKKVLLFREANNFYYSRLKNGIDDISA